MLIRTTNIERVINSSDNPAVGAAIEELHAILAVNGYLLSHLKAVKQQTDASIAGIRSLLHQFESDSPANILGGTLD